MRSPVIAFGIFAAAAVSPSLVSAAPTSPQLGGVAAPGVPADPTTASPVGNPLRAVPMSALPVRRELEDHHSDKHHKSHRKHERRVDDYRTAGGNAYSGVSGNVSGGNSINNADSDDDEIMNNDSSELS